MSDVTMADAEPDDGTDDQISPPPFKFLLSPAVWSLCQARPFPFLDLPPELRNRIYEQAFTGCHGLSPHHLTQVNRQIASESDQMFHAETHTLQIPLQTPKQMTCFLDWIVDAAPDFSLGAQVYEFTYTDIDVGITTIRFTPVWCYPAVALQRIKDRAPPGSSDRDVLRWTWHLLLGLRSRNLLQNFEELLKSEEPPALFIEAIINGSQWNYYMMEFVGEREPSFPATSFYGQQFVLQFIRLLTRMANKGWCEKFLRDIAGFLFMRSMQAGTKAKRVV
jgi:hypothetical protein